MADPVVISCDQTCTITVQHELILPPLQLNAVEGAAIASAVLAIWVIGWAFRVLIRTLDIDGKTNQESD